MGDLQFVKHWQAELQSSFQKFIIYLVIIFLTSSEPCRYTEIPSYNKTSLATAEWRDSAAVLWGRVNFFSSSYRDIFSSVPVKIKKIANSRRLSVAQLMGNGKQQLQLCLQFALGVWCRCLARVSPIDLFGQQLHFKHTHSSGTDTKSFPVIQFRNISSFPGAFHIDQGTAWSRSKGDYWG